MATICLQVNTDRFRHTITNPNIVQDFPVDVLRAMGSDRFDDSSLMRVDQLHMAPLVPDDSVLHFYY